MKKFMFIFIIGFFLFGCIGVQEQPHVIDEEIIEETIVPPVKEEKKIPTIRFIDYPLELNAKEGARFLVEVKDGKDVLNNLFVYVWEDSVMPSKYPVDYIYSSESISQTARVDHYETYIAIEKAGKYYARALIVVDGEYYWSEEAVLNVLTPDGKNVKTFNVDLTYSNIVPNNIIVNKGDIVVINFKASEDSHPNGVRILSPGWKDSPALRPGQEFSVEFGAANSFSYRMFWLAGNLLQATATVTVN